MKLPHEEAIEEFKETIDQIKDQRKKHKNKKSFFSRREILNFEKKLNFLKKRIYSKLTPLDRVAISRHLKRPKTKDFIENIFNEFEEISGDRLFRDDKAVICGFAKILKERFVIVGLEKGKNTESRIFHNFGMAHPEGYRKALRVMQLAAKFSIPVVSFIDTPGAYPGLSAEERGQGFAIAKNLYEMAKLPIPIIVVLIGEGCSGGALGLAVGDRIGMLQHSYYSVISPEGCASILWKDASKAKVSSKALKMQSEDMLKFKVIDEIIKEPLGGAHKDPKKVYENVKKFILESCFSLKDISLDKLLEKRYKKFRRIGDFTVS